MKKLLFLTGFLLCSITIFGQSITPIPAGQTWSQARTRINANDNIASDSIASLKAATNQNYGFIESLNDSIAAHLGKINLKQNILVSGTSIKTINGSSLLGSGDITIEGGEPDSTVFATVNYVDIQIGQVEAGEFDTIEIYNRLNDTISLQSGYGIDLVEGTGTLTVRVDTSQVATPYDLTQITGGTYDSTYIHQRTDSLALLVTTLRDSLSILNTEVESIWDALANLGTDLVGPRFDSAWIRSDTLWVTYQIPDVETDSVPAIANFNLTEGGTTFGIDSIWFSNDSIMVAKLDSVGLYGASYLLDYTRTNAYPQLQDTLGNLALSWTNKAVTNNVDEPVIEDDEAEFTLTSTGDGSGVATLRMRSSNTVNVTLSGSGYFYTNSGGTEGESQTWQVTSGAMRTIYLKVGSSTSTMTIDYANRVTRWGDADGDGWVSSSNAPSLSGDIAQMSDTALTHIRHSGSSTLSGEIGTLTALTYIRIAGAVTFSGSIANLDPTYIELSSWGNMTVSGSIAGFTDATRIVITGSTTVSGSIAGLTTCTYFNIGGSNTVSGSITGLTSATRIQASGSNTLSGNTSIGAVYLRIYGGSSTVEWATRTWPNNCEYFNVATSSGTGWSIANITAAIAGASGVTWSGERTFDLGSINHSSMADTNQGGIWGDFSGTAAPSTLATNLKTLVRTRTVTTSLRGISIPGGTGDGTGFPSGFGNWWRE